MIYEIGICTSKRWVVWSTVVDSMAIELKYRNIPYMHTYICSTIIATRNNFQQTNFCLILTFNYTRMYIFIILNIPPVMRLVIPVSLIIICNRGIITEGEIIQLTDIVPTLYLKMHLKLDQLLPNVLLRSNLQIL